MQPMKNYFYIFVILLIFITSYIPACAAGIEKEKIKTVFNQTTGVITGVVVNSLIGFVRGGISGWRQGVKQTAKAFGNEDVITYKAIGALTYGLIKGSAGAIVGIFRGEENAFKFGLSSPWTKENFNLGGSDFLDYNPFEND